MPPPTVINGNGDPLPALSRRSSHAPPPAPTPSSSSASASAAQHPQSFTKRPAPADTSRKHSATFTVTSGSERVVHVYPDRTSSGGSASARSPLSSDGSLSTEDSWSELELEDDDEEIGPSDSASRARPPPPPTTSRRHTVEAVPAPRRRHSSRREVIPEREEEAPRRHSSRQQHSSRHERHDRHDSHSRHGRSSSRRVGSDESSSTVASADDYPPYGRHGMPRAAYPPPRGYSQAAAHSHGGYPPSMTSAAPYHDPYPPPHQALVRMQQDPFGYPPRQPNPFSSHPQEPNPFSPTTEHSSYFATDAMGPPPPRHHRPDPPQRPQSFAAPSHFGTEVMAPHYGGMPSYGGHYGMPGYPYPPSMHGWPPSESRSPPPPPKDDRVAAEMEALRELIKKRDDDDSKGKKDKQTEIDSLKELIKKHEEEAIARQKAWMAEREAEAAAKAAEKAKAEEEKKRKAEIDDARKKAKEDAEKKAEEAAKKAKDEHEKKLAEAEKAKEEADKAKKALEEEIAKSKPTPDSLKPPIKFKDALGRTFRFPWHLCKTWKGMETLIKQAFMHIDGIGDHVHHGHYDLLGPDGEIILPQVWDTMIQPDWEISMHMWPMDEKKEEPEPLHDPFANLGIGDFPPGFGGMGGMGGMLPGEGPLPKKKGSKKEKDGKKKAKGGGSPDMMFRDMMPPPPPPQHGGMKEAWPDPFAGLGGGGIEVLPQKPLKDKNKARTKSRSGKEISPLAAWFAGGSLNAKPAKKR